MRALRLLLPALLTASAVAAQEPRVTPPDAQPQLVVDTASGAFLRVYLATSGPGSAVWELFGHNAIWIQDSRTGQTLSYNWGLFDFQQEGFVPRLVRGGMLYWIAPFDAQREADTYAYYDRSVTVQELALSPAQRAHLAAFVEWNAREENKFYNYHYYRDNCSTRIRDAIDRVLGGQLRAQLSAIPSEQTFRSHSLRLAASAPLTWTGMELGLADSVDHRLTAWEEAFVPMELMRHMRSVRIASEAGGSTPIVANETSPFTSTRPQPPEHAPNRVPIYLLLGIVTGGVFLLLARLAPRSRAARWVFAIFGAVWGAKIGLFGLLVLLLWTSTGHTFTYGNENLFQVNPLPLLLVVLIPAALLGRRWAARPAFIVAAFITAISLIGLAAKVLPGFDQMNHDILALMVPAHLGVAGALFLAGRALYRRVDA